MVEGKKTDTTDSFTNSKIAVEHFI